MMITQIRAVKLFTRTQMTTGVNSNKVIRDNIMALAMILISDPE
jgi:hypothetical protein